MYEVHSLFRGTMSRSPMSIKVYISNSSLTLYLGIFASQYEYYEKAQKDN